MTYCLKKDVAAGTHFSAVRSASEASGAFCLAFSARIFLIMGPMIRGGGRAAWRLLLLLLLVLLVVVRVVPVHSLDEPTKA